MAGALKARVPGNQGEHLPEGNAALTFQFTCNSNFSLLFHQSATQTI